MTSWPDPVVVEASSNHTASVIFLHGLGDSGHGWASTLSSIKPPGVKLICPSANKMPVTLNSGFTMPSWFDLKSLNPNGPEDEASLCGGVQCCRLSRCEHCPWASDIEWYSSKLL